MITHITIGGKLYSRKELIDISKKSMENLQHDLMSFHGIDMNRENQLMTDDMLMESAINNIKSDIKCQKRREKELLKQKHLIETEIANNERCPHCKKSYDWDSMGA